MRQPSWPLDNVWFGVSVEDQAGWDERVEVLLETRARSRFVSYEPALGPLLDTRGWLGDSNIEWVIAGGESGRFAREVDLLWFQSLRDACRRDGAAFFCKQLGSAWAKSAHARDSHGGNPAEWPPDLRVREFPRGMQRLAA
jgi:protein gp37